MHSTTNRTAFLFVLLRRRRRRIISKTFGGCFEDYYLHNHDANINRAAKSGVVS